MTSVVSDRADGGAGSFGESLGQDRRFGPLVSLGIVLAYWDSACVHGIDLATGQIPLRMGFSLFRLVFGLFGRNATPFMGLRRSVPGLRFSA